MLAWANVAEEAVPLFGGEVEESEVGEMELMEERESEVQVVLEGEVELPLEIQAEGGLELGVQTEEELDLEKAAGKRREPAAGPLSTRGGIKKERLLYASPDSNELGDENEHMDVVRNFRTLVIVSINWIAVHEIVLYNSDRWRPTIMMRGA
jgi:hypothetical protein